MDQKQILVLGVGNILLRDEGVGVRVVEKIQETYAFSPNVRLLDGGTLGLKLLEPILEADHLILVDVLKTGKSPGTIQRLSLATLRKRVSLKYAAHQLEVLETLAHAEFLGSLPHTVIVGIEPEDISTLNLKLSESVRSRLADLVSAVLEEITNAGGGYHPRVPGSFATGAVWKFS